MAYTAGQLFLHSNAPGDVTYFYDAGSDALATVMGVGYFNNTDDNLQLVAGDRIMVKATDGNATFIVAAVSTATATLGQVALQYAGGDLPIQTYATGTEAALAKAKVGFYEVGTSIATATRVVLPTPYPGAVVAVRKIGSGTQAVEFDAGASASNVSLSASEQATSGGTGVTYDGTRRRITLKAETEGFRVRASSTSRWRIEDLDYNASAISEGGSVVFLGT